MFISFFLIFSYVASTIFEISNPDNAVNDIVVQNPSEDIHKENISNIFKKRLSFDKIHNTESIFFCISVPKNVSLKVITDIKRILNLSKKEDEVIYYRQVKNVCGNIYQGFDKPIEFMDDFIDFSLFYKYYPSNVNILEFKKHSFSFAVNFSDSSDTPKESNPNNQQNEYTEGEGNFYKNEKYEQDIKNIPDLYMLTDLKESYENYLSIREKLQHDINEFYSTPEKIFADHFKKLSRNYSLYFDQILKLFFYPSFIMKNGNLWTFFYQKKFEEVKSYFKSLLYCKQNESIDRGDLNQTPNDYLKSMCERNEEIVYLKTIIDFFRKINEKDWDDVLTLLKEYASNEKNTHIFCALNKKNVFVVKNYLNIVFKEIGEDLYMQKKLFFSLYIFEKWHKVDDKKTYYMNIKESKNIKEFFSIKNLSMIVLKTKICFLRLFFQKGTYFEFIETYNNIGSAISNENVNILKYDLILNYNSLDVKHFYKANILVLKPYPQKYTDVDIFKWLNYHIENIFKSTDILSINRYHIINKDFLMNCGFIGFHMSNLCKSTITMPFLKRELFYKSFIHNFINFVKINNLIVEDAYITDDTNCFVPFCISNLNVEIFQFKNNEILFNQRKKQMGDPKKNNRLDLRLPWVRSQIEFLFSVRENDGMISKTIFKIELEEDCREFFHNSFPLNNIFDVFDELINCDLDDNHEYKKLCEIFRDNGMRLLRVGTAEKICRIIYEGDLTKSKFYYALDLLISDVLFQAYLDRNNVLERNQLNDEDIDYIHTYIKDLKNRILARKEIDCYDRLKINSSIINFSITNYFEKHCKNQVRDNEIYKMISNFSWD